jgi:hypothetical protein
VLGGATESEPGTDELMGQVDWSLPCGSDDEVEPQYRCVSFMGGVPKRNAHESLGVVCMPLQYVLYCTCQGKPPNIFQN